MNPLNVPTRGILLFHRIHSFSIFSSPKIRLNLQARFLFFLEIWLPFPFDDLAVGIDGLVDFDDEKLRKEKMAS